MESDPSVLHVLVVGFHHKKGCIVEYSWPPMIPGGKPQGPELPSQWRHLPSLSLPDGSHNYRQDASVFHLPDLHDPRKTVFGISCYRQIESDKLYNKSTEITRSSVQKALCVLSRLPLYGQIRVKMSLITEAYFREADFTRWDLIHQTYDNLNACLEDSMLYTQQLYVGLSARNLVARFKQRTLVLFKLLLLERKILFFLSPVEELTEIFLTLLSLHPGMLESGLGEAARMVPAETPTSSPIPPLPNSLRAKLKPKEETNDEEEPEAQVEIPSLSHILNLSTKDLNLPLKIFTEGNLCHPYLCLPFLDVLSDPSIRGYFIGATNILFKQKRGIYDVLVDIQADNKIEISDPELKKYLALTTEDLRFMDNIVKHVSEENVDVFMDGVGWEGGDEWVRAQFRLYLVCLLRSSLEDVPEFNSSFLTAWKKTNNYKYWIESAPATLGDFPIGHPYSGQYSVSDMKLHLTNSITNSEGGKRVSAAVANTGKAVAGGLSSAKGAFSSWIGSFKFDASLENYEDEEKDHTNVVIPNNEK
ncbi:late secretory pathway protein AVL9 homolog [Lepeophtheirus salmonis]|uniref:Late secretory pathway protein AVL9 homolog [Acyrthosiphon pisum] n=1 Tax=Lepeophtheirus salmonis TaxID=72036 RepID=A0A0K2U2V7_LEPSM|nr:late secretory pathway protein AVL9 homolog [Lepeophtheirus salmonis]